MTVDGDNMTQAVRDLVEVTPPAMPIPMRSQASPAGNDKWHSTDTP
jgi:hypothetical protein